MAGNLVIVAVPDENDRVWKVSSEKVPHLTLLFLGDVEKVNNLDQIMQFVEHAANTTLSRFYLPVDRRGELGDDPEKGPADVLFFKKGRYDYKAIRDFRATLLQDNNIKTAYDSAPQFEGPWQPHLTLGYPQSTPANEDKEDHPFWDVSFNKIAVWTGDFEGPDFLLKDYWDEFDALETVPMDVAMSDIEHHGVKGMKWGVRKAASVGKSVGKGALKVASDIHFESQSSQRAAANHVSLQASVKHANEDLPKLKEKYSGTKAETLKGRMKNPLDKNVAAYRADARVMFRDRINEEVAKLPTNASGTRKYQIEDGGRTNAQYSWRLKTVDVKRTVSHADTVSADALPDQFIVRPVFDADGWITSVEFEDIEVNDPIAQTTDLGAEFLAHYGIKGMRWGHRKEAPAAVPASAMSHVPQGARRKTKIAVQGGENHPAHEDALKVAQAQAKLKKSGPSALSNKELRDMQERLNLERNVTQLVGSTTRVGKGRQFVRNITGVNQEVNNAANAGMQSHRLGKQFRSNFA
jgi:2'-5' RNA ligase